MAPCGKSSVWQLVVCGFFFFSVLLALLLAAGFSYLLCKKSPYVNEGEIGVVISKSGDSSVTKVLRGLCVSEFPLVSGIALRLFRWRGHSVKLGEYALPNHVSLIDCLKIFSSHQSIKRKFTIPEGFSVQQVIDRLQANKYLLGDIIEIPEEGSLMPETYVFKYPTTRQQIITFAKNAMTKFMNKYWESYPKNQQLKTKQDVITLASIVEKETHKERNKVAGVYMNRLKNKMRLQADPTVVYALTRGRPLNRKLRTSDMRLNIPYNTYRKAGLPPTPICNPGKSSILAVLNPEKTDAMFFLHSESPYGMFAKTFAEHNKNRQATSLR